MCLRVLEELHDVGVKGVADDSEALESGGVSQSLELGFGPLFAAGGVGQHDDVAVGHPL